MQPNPTPLFEIAYQYYPRRLSAEQPAYKKSKEYQRRRKACRLSPHILKPWRAMLLRLAQHFPHEQMIDDTRFFLESDDHPPPSLSGAILFAQVPHLHSHSIEFCVSLLSPYYKIQSRLVTDDIQPHDTQTKPQKSLVRLELSPSEQPYGTQIAHEIETAYAGYTPMPPELGTLIVPELASFGGRLGQVSIYDCLLSPIA